jgi:hypothetical protein
MVAQPWEGFSGIWRLAPRSLRHSSCRARHTGAVVERCRSRTG